MVNARRPIGRDAVIENFRSGADLGLTTCYVDTIATRGGRLVLTRDRYWRGDEDPEALSLSSSDSRDRRRASGSSALVTFDPDDFEAAIAEFDARYLAGEAAAHSHAWSIVAGLYAGFNRHERPATTPDLATSTTGRS